MGTRETKYFERLSRKISHIEPKKYVLDRYESYNLIDPKKPLIGKSHTYTVERMNRLLRYYLARFRRKTYCWSKNLGVINDSVLLQIFSFYSYIALPNFILFLRYRKLKII